jgi:hypothetical protein
MHKGVAFILLTLGPADRVSLRSQVPRNGPFTSGLPTVGASTGESLPERPDRYRRSLYHGIDARTEVPGQPQAACQCVATYHGLSEKRDRRRR